MRIDLLDHGYLELIETWGSEEGIIEAARMSTGKGFLGWGPEGLECPSTKGDTTCGWKGKTREANTRTTALGGEYMACPRCGDPGLRAVPGDEKLLRFLYENAHATPFEMAGAIIEVRAPIFVFREWHRHRTQSYNERSARYAPLPDENYVPSVERLLVNSKTNKQAGTIKGAAELTEYSARTFQMGLEKIYKDAERHYQTALQAGVPKELARIHLPVGRYSCMRASANLRNWLAFLTLRMAKNAQYEIRMYANAVHDILVPIFPKTMSLFDET